MNGGPKRLGKVLRKLNGYSLVEVLDSASAHDRPIGYCVLGPDPRVDTTWLLDLPTAETAFDVRISTELTRPRRKLPIRRRPRS